MRSAGSSRVLGYSEIHSTIPRLAIAFENEPLSATAAARFVDVPNLILTSHIAGITEEANAQTGALTIANVRAVLEA